MSSTATLTEQNTSPPPFLEHVDAAMHLKAIKIKTRRLVCSSVPPIFLRLHQFIPQYNGPPPGLEHVDTAANLRIMKAKATMELVR